MAKGYSWPLHGPVSRQRACQAIMGAPDGSYATVAPPKRSDAQNRKLWAMLSDIAMAKPLGRRHTPDDWKAIFMNACGWDCQFVEGLEGRPFPLGFRSSNLTKDQMGDLLNYIDAFGAEHGVVWSEPQEQAA